MAYINLFPLISDEFREYAVKKSEYSNIFRRKSREVEKKASNELKPCDYDNGNYKTKAE